MSFFRDSPQPIQLAESQHIDSGTDERCSKPLIQMHYRRILVVDNTPTNVQLLRILLSKKGYEVKTAFDGETALEYVQTDPPDLILLDIFMPEMDGYEVCKYLKINPKTCDIPIIFISAQDEIEGKVKAFESGGVDYIIKPFHAAEVLARVETHLTIRRLQRQLQAQNETLQQEIHVRKQAEISLHQQAERERLMMQISQRIRQSLRLEDTLNTTVQEVQQLLHADRAIIFRIQDETQGTVLVESVDAPWESICGRALHDPCFAEHYIERYRQGRVYAIADIYNPPLTPCYVNMLSAFQVRANLIVPIVQKEQLWGLLIVHQCSDARHWQSWEIELLQQLATQLAIAIQQSELYEQLTVANHELERLATLDGLTQVANRRRFDEYLQQEWIRSQREQMPLSLILCDVDHFKHYNDHYGHQMGDLCLKQVAQAIRTHAQRPADLVARYGGEEFVIVLPNTDPEGACHIAARINDEMQALKIPPAASGVCDHVTISIGVSTVMPSHERSPATLIETADQALYQVKTHGRNGYQLRML
ncbi:MAG TPA: diguanylate cyclase [Chroococcidiopsis sp.]